jgi:hypothetical protein
VTLPKSKSEQGIIRKFDYPLIVLSGLGLSDEEFRFLLDDWIVPRLVEECLRQNEPSSCKRTSNHSIPNSDWKSVA